MADHAEMALNIPQQVVYLMGGSFILGSMCTILLVMVLDFMRRNK